jgi:hypothetical protein
LTDFSPFVEALSFSEEVSKPLLQEWQRSNGKNKFSLTKFASSYVLNDKELCELLLLETHLEELNMPVSKKLLSRLSCLSSIRALKLAGLSNDLVESLSKLLPQAPFIRSLSLSLEGCHVIDNLSVLPLSTLTSFKASFSSVNAVSAALIKSKPKSLTSLELTHVMELTSASFEVLAGALLDCPSLTRLTISEDFTSEANILPVVQVLSRLPLSSLTLNLYKFTDASIECLLSFLPQSAVQDLSLGTLSPKQEQLLADSLPSFSSLQSLMVNLCEHASSHLALFSALPSSPLRSLTLHTDSFRQQTLVACLNKIPDTQLTYAFVKYSNLYPPSFDPNRDDPRKFGTQIGLKRRTVLEEYNEFPEFRSRFPLIEDRFCFLNKQ